MLCNIAELLVDIPAAGGLAPRCQEYLIQSTACADIVIDETQYRIERYPAGRVELITYMESGAQFYNQLLRYNGMMLHASAVAVDNRAYLFSGPCRTGKSTHSRLWQSLFGEAAQVFNDDKPALRRMDGRWFAYGTPWCGKDGINQNKKVPLAGICFLKQSQENAIRRLSPQEAIARVISQTPHQFHVTKDLDLLLKQVDNLVKEIPIFELQNRPELDAARLSFMTMRDAAQEAGL